MDAILQRHARRLCENYGIPEVHAALAQDAIRRHGYAKVDAWIRDAEKLELQPSKTLELILHAGQPGFDKILQIHPLAEVQAQEHADVFSNPKPHLAPLLKFLRHVPAESRVELTSEEKPRAWLQVRTVTSGKAYPHSHVWAFAYPRLSESESQDQHRDLDGLNQVTTEQFYRLHKGAVDIVGLNVMLEDGKPVVLISNVQHRRQYYDLNRTNKRRFNRAYVASIRAIRQWAETAGMAAVYHLDEEHAAQRMRQTYDVQLPKRAKEQFYRNAPKKAGLDQRKKVVLTDPLTKDAHSLGVWATVPVTGTKPRGQEPLRAPSTSTADRPRNTGRP